MNNTPNTSNGSPRLTSWSPASTSGSASPCLSSSSTSWSPLLGHSSSSKAEKSVTHAELEQQHAEKQIRAMVDLDWKELKHSLLIVDFRVIYGPLTWDKVKPRFPEPYQLTMAARYQEWARKKANDVARALRTAAFAILTSDRIPSAPTFAHRNREHSPLWGFFSEVETQEARLNALAEEIFVATFKPERVTPDNRDELFYFAHAAGRAVLLLHERWHQALKAVKSAHAYESQLAALRLANTFRIHKSSGELLVILEFGETNVDATSLPPPLLMPFLDTVRRKSRATSGIDLTESVANFLNDLTDID
eukprot:TRINITY_DN1230_c0_g1_i1.p1 TRINITY_DN1230_c0_g1~~TRINITY_DN1230_c0_g1_i1.p1  ORF type:complete len:307 (-),score=36.98 TRINITY_DN1230_c0_g1_i1:71-991(-)